MNAALKVGDKPQATRFMLTVCGLWLLTSCAFVGRTQAQDIHFSQFFNTPYALSPASIGAFDGDYRIGGVMRQQWRSVTVPYRTFGLGGDAAHVAGIKGLGAGLWAYDDRAGDAHLNTFHIDLGASWTQRFGASKEQSLTLGLQAGITSINIDYSALRFDAQYNGFYFDPSLANNEQFTRDAITHVDLHSGLTYRYVRSTRENLEIGYALFNITTPDVALFDAAASPLDRRGVMHVRAQFAIAKEFDLIPVAQYMAQEKFNEFDIGGVARYIMLDHYGVVHALQFGLLGRTSDAGYVYAGLEYEDWTFGLSYDVNLSSLRPASRDRGGFEVTAVRIFRKKPRVPVRFKACPDQL